MLPANLALLLLWISIVSALFPSPKGIYNESAKRFESGAIARMS
jgi:hypothetical protein